MKALGSILGGVGKDLATGQVCDALIAGCKQICTQPSAMWIATIAGLAAGPQLWLCLLGGSVLVEWHKTKKGSAEQKRLEAEARERFAALMGELTELRAAADRNDVVNDRLTRILDREDFVLARLPGYEKADIATAVGREVERVLTELGIIGAGAREHLDALLTIQATVIKTRDIAAANHRIAVQTESRIEQLAAQLEDKLDRLGEGLDRIPDEAIREPIKRMIREISDEALRGGITAGSVLDIGTPEAALEFKIARRKQRARAAEAIAASADALRDQLIEDDREIAAVALLTGRIDDAEVALQRILALLPEDLDAINRLGHVAQQRHKYDEALLLYSKVLNDSPDELCRSIAMNGIGTSIICKATPFDPRCEQELREALKYLLESQSIDVRRSQHQSVALGLSNISLAYLKLGELTLSEDFLLQSIEMSSDFGFDAVLAKAYGNLGFLYLFTGPATDSERFLRLAVRMHEASGRTGEVARQLNRLGILRISLKDIDGARGFLSDASKLFNQLGLVVELQATERLLEELNRNPSSLLIDWST